MAERRLTRVSGDASILTIPCYLLNHSGIGVTTDLQIVVI